MPPTQDPLCSDFGKADLQVHTAFGDGMEDAQTLFDFIEEQSTLDVVAVTDHDDVAGSLLAREIHTRNSYSFDLVTGIEITTISGHLLALWVDEPIPSFRSLSDTIRMIHEKGGLAVIPHPFSHLTRSVGRRALQKVMNGTDESAFPDGIEIASPSSMHPLAGLHAGKRVAGYNSRHWKLAETGGSDAHFVEAVGSAYTSFPGKSSESLRQAIMERTTQGHLDPRFSIRSIGLGRLVRQQVRGLSVTPKKIVEKWRQR